MAGMLTARARRPAAMCGPFCGSGLAGRELDRIHVGTFTEPAGTFRQRTELTKRQRDILSALRIDAPRVYQLQAARETSEP